MPDARRKAFEALGVPRESIPRHVAIIMDGNGRWAKERGLPRIRGHEAGAKMVREIVTECARLELEALTLYSFSTENWSRPQEEIDFLMELYGRYLVAERPEIMENNVRLVHIGRRQGLPDHVLREMDLTLEASAANSGLRLCLALNYSSRVEIVDAVRHIAGEVQAGQLQVGDIDEQCIADSLYTGGLPDPDLLIRTASEHRVSNFLLWQISYAELHVCDVYWPDFGVESLRQAIRDYARRERRYGALASAGKGTK
ncbi:MAG: isoprenyl transferase [bacterium]|nr:isoprenyl transferase [bacterium]